MSDATVLCLRGATWRLYPCKLWTGAINGRGYGHRNQDGKDILVHREALTQKLGRPIAPGLFSLHHCDTPTCHEPEHLYEGTQIDNMRDMANRKRQALQLLTMAEHEEIRHRIAAGGVLHRELAAEYGVARATITGIVHRKGRDNRPHRDKLTADDVRAIRRRHQDGEAPADLAREYGVARPQIYKVLHRRAWALID